MAQRTAPARPAPASSDLARALDVEAECSGVRLLEGNLFEISFRAPEMARRARPGEFAQIWTEPTRLRRPFSFSRAEPEEGLVGFYVGAVGQVTSLLRRFQPGQRARLLGPLGRGFTLPPSPGRSLLLAGGLGAAPFPLLAQQLLGAGEEVVWLNGARSSAELYPRAWLPASLKWAELVTEDGSQGTRGLVTGPLAQLLDKVDRVYACGPNPMLRAVWRRIGELRPELPVEVSIEAPMGCGFGTCLGCAVPLAEGSQADYGLCCRQGPVLAAGELDWERLLGQPSHLE